MQKNLELVGDYTKSLGLHNLGAMIGYSYQDDDAKGIYQWAKIFQQICLDLGILVL